MEEFKRCGKEWFDKPTLDPLIWARYLWPKTPNKLADVIQKLRISVSGKSLTGLGIKKKQHRADYDSFITGMCLFEMQRFMPKSLRQTLDVQDFLYRMWLMNMGDQKFARQIEPTMPE